MKKIHSALSMSLAVSLGAVVASCGSFSSGSSGSGGSSSSGSGGSSATGGSTGSGGATGSGGSGATTGSGGSSSGGSGGGSTPCSILAAAGNACVAAHSTVRVVYPGYSGPLYQVCKGSFTAGPNSCTSGMTLNIGSVAGGYADYMSQDSFCSGGTCTISIIYDQSPKKNDLYPAPPGGAGKVNLNPASATALRTTLNGQTVYGVLIKPVSGYRAGCTGCKVVKPNGTATGDQAETEYMVTSQNSLVDGCCFDYGNAETDSHDDGNGTMEAVYFGGGVVWDSGAEGGHHTGSNTSAVPNPWVMADLENGLFAGFSTSMAANSKQTISSNTAVHSNFVTAVIVGDVASQNSGKGRFAIYGGDATNGVLKTMYDGIRPNYGGYVPMQKQGSIILGTGGDNSDSGGGEWFEGVMASGAATLATVNALQANVVAAGYGK